MEDEINDLAALARRIKAKRRTFLKEARGLNRKLNTAFKGLPNVGGISEIVTLEKNAVDDAYYGFLYYRHSELGICYRHSDDDMDDARLGIPSGPPMSRDYSAKPIAECDTTWIERAMDEAVLASLRQNIRAGLEDTDQRLDRLLSNLKNLPLFEATDLESIPSVPREDLIKAAQRFRDGDLGGAISAACGAVDAVVASIYKELNLQQSGRKSSPSFQEGCTVALNAVLHVKSDLQELGWEAGGATMLAKNFKDALNNGAYVMQALRSKMGDVHGTKPVLVPLAFDVLKWAEIMVRTLTTR